MTHIKQQPIAWSTHEEQDFIDECIDGLSPPDKFAWLYRYRGSCARRTNWDGANGPAVLSYIDRRLKELAA